MDSFEIFLNGSDDAIDDDTPINFDAHDTEPSAFQAEDNFDYNTLDELENGGFDNVEDIPTDFEQDVEADETLDIDSLDDLEIPLYIIENKPPPYTLNYFEDGTPRPPNELRYRKELRLWILWKDLEKHLIHFPQNMLGEVSINDKFKIILMQYNLIRPKDPHHEPTDWVPPPDALLSAAVTPRAATVKDKTGALFGYYKWMVAHNMDYSSLSQDMWHTAYLHSQQQVGNLGQKSVKLYSGYIKTYLICDALNNRPVRFPGSIAHPENQPNDDKRAPGVGDLEILLQETIYLLYHHSGEADKTISLNVTSHTLQVFLVSALFGWAGGLRISETIDLTLHQMYKLIHGMSVLIIPKKVKMGGIDMSCLVPWGWFLPQMVWRAAQVLSTGTRHRLVCT
jgi:hypothetical protein